MEKSQPKNRYALAFLDGAIAYQVAANKLREIMNVQPPAGLPLRDPTYFLYHHAVELALKACLLAHGATIQTGRTGHNISGLFDECQSKKFLKLKDEREINNLIAILGSGDNALGYRYPQVSRHFIPDLTWVDEVVAQLIEAVAPDLATWAKNSHVPGPSKIKITMGKPNLKKKLRK
jgi:hypothetical protein